MTCIQVMEMESDVSVKNKMWKITKYDDIYSLITEL